MKLTRQQILDIFASITALDNRGAEWKNDEIRETFTDFIYYGNKYKKDHEEYFKNVTDEFKKLKKIEGELQETSIEVQRNFQEFVGNHKKYLAFLNEEIDLKEVTPIKREDLKGSKYVVSYVTHLFGTLIV